MLETGAGSCWALRSRFETSGPQARPDQQPAAVITCLQTPRDRSQASLDTQCHVARAVSTVPSVVNEASISNFETMNTHRRALIVSGLATAALPAVAGETASVTAQDLLRLSASLVQRPPEQLDADVAGRILQHYRARGLSARLARLQVEPDSDPALAAELVAAWYTGVCQTASGPQVVAFTEALVWTCAGFLHPSGFCGGATQYWAAPPAV